MDGNTHLDYYYYDDDDDDDKNKMMIVIINIGIQIITNLLTYRWCVCSKTGKKNTVNINLLSCVYNNNNNNNKNNRQT